ncbi:hypothetical protein BGZ49_006334 [Haplosporangium sp. Z 27]|nr:hypothetical protein BGZ49_006334 [Haplosporangium sp. Z 27]
MATPSVMISGSFQLKTTKRKLRDKLSEKEQAWPVFTLKEYAKMVLDSADRRGGFVPSQTLSLPAVIRFSPVYKSKFYLRSMGLHPYFGRSPATSTGRYYS